MKTAVITGASRGIGKATAEKFRSEGWSVIATSTDDDHRQAEDIQWVTLDLSSPESIAGAAEKIAAHKPIDVLVNNAGVYIEEKDLDDMPVDMPTLRRTLEVNLIGTIDLTERLVPHMAEHGHIISLGSNWGSLTSVKNSMASLYAISKVGIGMYTRKLAERVRGKNVTVSIIDPGWVRTDMGGDEAPRDPAEPAAEIYSLATSEVPTGQFWHKGQLRSW